MNADKKLTLIRLAIFLVLSCVPGIFIVIAVNSHLGAPMYSTPELMASPLVPLVGAVVMLFPALAALITRLVTKQGFKDALLELNIMGNVKYYVLAFTMPMVYSALGYLILYAYCGADFSEIFTLDYFWDNLPMALATMGATIPTIIVYFGEEWGWRGYLVPQLEKLIGAPAAVIVGGIIWGLWHAPVTISGHNFGIDYEGFPYLGILLMVVSCVFTGIFLTFITMRTKSVFPAVLAHGMNNNASAALLIPFASPTATLPQEPDVFTNFMISSIPTIILGAVCFIFIIKDSRKAKQAAESVR